MSSLSPSAAIMPPSPASNDLDSLSNLILTFISLALIIKLFFIIISRHGGQSRNPSTSTQDQDNNTMGLPIDVINSYHTFTYRKTEAINDSDYGRTCCICISDYREREILRMMPRCPHYFHRDCVDMWLTVNGSCPICRNSPLQVMVK